MDKLTVDKLLKLEKAGKVITSGTAPSLPFHNECFVDIPDDIINAWEDYLEAKEKLDVVLKRYEV